MSLFFLFSFCWQAHSLLSLVGPTHIRSMIYIFDLICVEPLICLVGPYWPICMSEWDVITIHMALKQFPAKHTTFGMWAKVNKKTICFALNAFLVLLNNIQYILAVKITYYMLHVMVYFNKTEFIYSTKTNQSSLKASPYFIEITDLQNYVITFPHCWFRSPYNHFTLVPPPGKAFKWAHLLTCNSNTKLAVLLPRARQLVILVSPWIILLCWDHQPWLPLVILFFTMYCQSIAKYFVLWK